MVNWGGQGKYLREKVLTLSIWDENNTSIFRWYHMWSQSPTLHLLSAHLFTLAYPNQCTFYFAFPSFLLCLGLYWVFIALAGSLLHWILAYYPHTSGFIQWRFCQSLVCQWNLWVLTQSLIQFIDFWFTGTGWTRIPINMSFGSVCSDWGVFFNLCRAQLRIRTIGYVRGNANSSPLHIFDPNWGLL